MSWEPLCLLLDTTPASSASRRTNRTKDAQNRTCLFLPTGAMVVAVLKLYFIGTALTVLAVLYGIADSFGGLMYVQDQRYFLELDHQTQGQFSSGNHQRGPSVKTKHMDS